MLDPQRRSRTALPGAVGAGASAAGDLFELGVDADKPRVDAVHAVLAVFATERREECDDARQNAEKTCHVCAPSPGSRYYAFNVLRRPNLRT